MSQDPHKNIYEPVMEICRRLDLNPNMVQSLEVFPDRVFVTEYADPKRIEDGEPVLRRYFVAPVNTSSARSTPGFFDSEHR